MTTDRHAMNIDAVTYRREDTTATRPTAASRHLATMFHLAALPGEHDVLDACTIPLPERGAVLLRGPSGSGKSTLLRRLVAGARRGDAGHFVVHEVGSDQHSTLCTDDTALDVLVARSSPREPLHERVLGAAYALTSAGIHEPHVMATPVRHLSDGQRHRFRIARALHDITSRHADLEERSRVPGRAEHQRFLLAIDELGGALDPETAASVARSLARFIATSPAHVTVIAATHRPEVEDALQPRVLVTTWLFHSAVHASTREEIRS